MVGDHSFTDAEAHGAETMTVAQILAKSSNIGTIKIAQKVGKQSLYDRLMAFGFGKETALGFPDESHGTVPAPDTWWTTSMGTIPIGQGVSATPDAGAVGLQHHRQPGHLRRPPPGRQHHRLRRPGAPHRQ